MKKVCFLFAMMFMALSFVGCGNNDDNINDGSRILNKWWYDSDNVTADIYFNSNGKYEQKIVVLGSEFTGEGDWDWVDQEAGILKISNLTGQGQLISSTLVKITDVTSNSITVQSSFDNGENYSGKVYYVDTDQ